MRLPKIPDSLIYNFKWFDNQYLKKVLKLAASFCSMDYSINDTEYVYKIQLKTIEMQLPSAQIGPLNAVQRQSQV